MQCEMDGCKYDGKVKAVRFDGTPVVICKRCFDFYSRTGAVIAKPSKKSLETDGSDGYRSA